MSCVSFCGLAVKQKTFADLMAKVALSHALFNARLLVAGVALGAGEGVNILIVEVALIA